jgi:hypothetical protein
MYYFAIHLVIEFLSSDDVSPRVAIDFTAMSGWGSDGDHNI